MVQDQNYFQNQFQNQLESRMEQILYLKQKEKSKSILTESKLSKESKESKEEENVSELREKLHEELHRITNDLQSSDLQSFIEQ